MTTAIERAVKPEIEAKQISPMALIQEALRGAVTPEEKQAAAGIVKELIALQQSMVRFEWEAQERQARIDFDDGLNECQAQIGRIAPNVQRNDTRSMWADYAQLDRAIRPIYTAAGFSVSYSEVEPMTPGKVRIKGTLSRGGVSREYFAEITPSTTGAKGNALVNATDADAIAQSRAKRYIMLDIFNVAVGIDKEEKKIMGEQMPEDKLLEFLDAFREAPDEDSAVKMFLDSHKCASEYKDEAANLRIDVFSIKHAASLPLAKKLYSMAYAKWRDANDGAALKSITEAWEAKKVSK